MALRLLDRQWERFFCIVISDIIVQIKTLSVAAPELLFVAAKNI